MSGIAAILNLDGSAVPQSEIERMANVLKAVWAGPAKNSDARKCGFCVLPAPSNAGRSV